MNDRQAIARKVYFVNQAITDDSGNLIPCIAVEGESGYHKTNWNYGKDFDLATECVDELNERMGYSKNEADLIILGTMRGNVSRG